MGQSLNIPRVIPNDWKRLDLIINKIKMNLGRDSNPTFNGLITSELTTSSLTLINTITEFSTDGTLGDNSDSAVPTEKAVKTYVDAAIINYEDTDAVLIFGGGVSDVLLDAQVYDAGSSVLI